MFHCTFTRAALALALFGTLAVTGCRSARSPESAVATRPPNVVIIFCDDLGYADIAPYGGRTPTPKLSRFAREGMRFTDFDAAQAVRSASRAALLTGCYPNRIGIQGALGPKARVGLNADERGPLRPHHGGKLF